MEAIILAGGVGSRLSDVIKDIPKPMALVNGKPFLEIIIDHLNDYGFKKVILSVGHLSDIIINHFGNEYKDIQIDYAVEEERLGTGGAIKYALNFCLEENVFILNGDTFLDIDFRKVKELNKKKNLPIIVSRNVEDITRYGSLIHVDNKLIDYREKEGEGEGEINAGCYYLPKKIMEKTKFKKSFSFEQISIPMIMKDPGFIVFNHEGIFIDIGIPSDLKAASDILRYYINY